MNPIQAVMDYLRRDLTPYPTGEVDRIGGQLGEAVLWSGRTALPGGIEGNLQSAALGYALAALTLLFSMQAVLWLVRELRRGNAGSTLGILVHTAAVVTPFLFAIVSLLYADARWHRADGISGGAVIVTANRIIEMHGSRRADIPASAVTRVTREGTTTRVSLGDRQSLVIETAPTETTRLDGALERVVEAAGSGTRILNDRLG